MPILFALTRGVFQRPQRCHAAHREYRRPSELEGLELHPLPRIQPTVALRMGGAGRSVSVPGRRPAQRRDIGGAAVAGHRAGVCTRPAMDLAAPVDSAGHLVGRDHHVCLAGSLPRNGRAQRRQRAADQQRLAVSHRRHRRDGDCVGGARTPRPRPRGGQRSWGLPPPCSGPWWRRSSRRQPTR